VIFILLLAVWLRTLKRTVARKTSELSESEERYRTLVDNLPIGVTVIDRNYRIGMVNKTQATMFGHAPAWFTGRFCYEEFEKRDATCSHCPGSTSMEKGTVEDVETEAVLDDSGPHPFGADFQ
jgi:PAS domain-containing protein